MVVFFVAGLLALALPVVPAHAAPSPVTVFDGSTVVGQPTPYYLGIKVLDRGRPTLEGRSFLTEVAQRAFKNLSNVSAFYADTFGWKSYDGKGSEIKVVVNLQKLDFLDLGGMRQNAGWVEQWRTFLFGAGGEELTNFSDSLDVVAHEYTHAVVSYSSGLNYAGQSGALNEHLADVFGAMIQDAIEKPAEPFLIGEDTLGPKLRGKYAALRDMLHPEKSLPAQPARISEIPKALGPGCRPAPGNDLCGVHLLNGIPNRAIALTVSRLGGWDRLRSLLFEVMTQRLGPDSDFADYRAKVMEACPRHGLSGAECRVLEESFAEVGIQ